MSWVLLGIWSACACACACPRGLMGLPLYSLPMFLRFASLNLAVHGTILKPEPNRKLESKPQVLSDQDAASQYVERLSKGQGKCVAELEEVARQHKVLNDITLTKVPWLDAETRSVYGLRALGQALLNPTE